MLPFAAFRRMFPGQPGRRSTLPGALSYRWMRRINLSRIRLLRKPQGTAPCGDRIINQYRAMSA
jgi:hypothetical protein